MERLTEKYNFKKFWDCLERQNRHCSKWDSDRTDQDVFVRRTLQRWFTNKYFRIEIENWDDHPSEIHISTQYVFIGLIRFGFGHLTEIVFYYTEPHLSVMKEKQLSINDFGMIKIVEAESDFRIL